MKHYNTQVNDEDVHIDGQMLGYRRVCPGVHRVDVMVGRADGEIFLYKPMVLDDDRINILFCSVWDFMNRLSEERESFEINQLTDVVGGDEPMTVYRTSDTAENTFYRLHYFNSEQDVKNGMLLSVLVTDTDEGCELELLDAYHDIPEEELQQEVDERMPLVAREILKLVKRLDGLLERIPAEWGTEKSSGY